MLKPIKIHEETYNLVKQIALKERRPFTTVLDIVVEKYAKENGYEAEKS